MVDELIYVYLHIDIHIHMSQVFRVVAKKRLCEPKQHQVRTCPGAMSETVRAEIVLGSFEVPIFPLVHVCRASLPPTPPPRRRRTCELSRGRRSPVGARVMT